MWFWYAIIASLLWGVGYVANQYLLRSFSSSEILFLESILIIILLLPLLHFTNGISTTFAKLANIKLFLILLGSGLIYISAASLILKSISASNASIAAIIEASYPIFTMLFAYLILGEVQFTLTSLIGCALVLAGLVVINL